MSYVNPQLIGKYSGGAGVPVQTVIVDKIIFENDLEYELFHTIRFNICNVQNIEWKINDVTTAELSLSNSLGLHWISKLEVFFITSKLTECTGEYFLKFKDYSKIQLEHEFRGNITGKKFGL